MASGLQERFQFAPVQVVEFAFLSCDKGLDGYSACA
jgi:hypothetical protein